ncbi:MAG: hypothetical protein AB8E82_17830 [Aureispira sp.]
MQLTSTQALTQLLKKKGITTLNELLVYVRKLPYGRNSSRINFSQVITEERGTCSSKHALVKAVADENGLENVQLMLCLYKMTALNTLGIGNALNEQAIQYIPEAHCYLKIDATKLDLTNEHSNIANIEADILDEKAILPIQVGSYKVNYHQQYLKNWLSYNHLPYTFEEIWKIREYCIKNLSL